MAKVLRPAGYTGSLQRITWELGNNVPVTAYLWGGAGGGGGNDSGTGGAGGGGAYTAVTFAINDGDVLEVAVGGPGGGGQSGASNAAGGSPGASYVDDRIFNTRTAVPTSGPGGAVFPQFNSRYTPFLNTNGVWINPSSAASFDKTYTVNFPTTNNYQFVGAADNSAEIYIDDVFAFRLTSYTSTYEIGLPISAGTHAIRIVGTNTGGPGAVALSIATGISFSGGRGGNSGGAGSSGAGGGGGGATVVILNGTAIAAAGGGGGGGGGGNTGTRNGQNAPGDRGQAAVGEYAGQNGTNKAGDGGGGGGGGGGWGGGQGGTTPGGDQGGFAGSFGLSSGSYVDPNGRSAGGTNTAYYPGNNAAFGGPTATQGAGGYAMFEFDVTGISVHDSGSFKPVIGSWIKVNNQWKQVKGVYIKESGTWLPVYGSITPDFVNVPDRFGVNPRSGVIETQGGDVISGGGESGGFDGGGGGGGKVICTALYQMGMMPQDLYEHDQRFGLWLYQNDPVAYKGYRKWADVLVAYMQGRGTPVLPRLLFWKTADQQQIMSKKIALRVGNFVGYAFAQEIARRAGHKVAFNLRGWLVVSAGLKVCKAIGYLYGLNKKSRIKK